MRVLEVEDLVSYYGKVEVVSHVTLHAEEGETVGLLGRNGAGKSALMRTIMGHAPPVRRSGSIRLRGEEIAGRAPHDIAQMGIGYAPDDHKIFPHLSTEENLILAQRLTHKSRQARSLDEIYSLFPLLKELRTRDGDVLSGGEKKLLTIARAVTQSPSVLMLDETSEGLSPVMVQQLVAVIQSLQKEEITMLTADQNLRFCAKVAKRGYVLERGRVQLSGSLEELWREMTGNELSLMA